MGNSYVRVEPRELPRGDESVNTPQFRTQFIGDSLTFGYGLTTAPPPPDGCVADLISANPPDWFNAYNQGINGASTADWAQLGGGKPLTNALAQIASKQITAVAIMLGTNDANLDNRNSTDYQTNMQFVIDQLVSAGISKIVINQPPYIKTQNLPGANALLVTYHTANSNLVTANPGVVVLGDTTAYAVFQTNVASYYQADGLHPNDTGATALAALWAASYPV